MTQLAEKMMQVFLVKMLTFVFAYIIKVVSDACFDYILVAIDWLLVYTKYQTYNFERL